MLTNFENKQLSDVIRLVRKAGEEVLEIYQGNTKKYIKKDRSFVTNADFLSEKIILKGLKKYNHVILSEETKDDLSRLKKEKIWIIDPLDGTNDFVNKTGEFSIMVGLVEKGKSILGVVYQPVKNKLYFAEKGKGSFLKEKSLPLKKLKVSDILDISKARFVFSRSHLEGKEKNFIKENHISNILFIGSAGLKMGLIAEGKADIYLSFSSRTCQWDTCAPEIILKEAGGELTDIEGEEFIYNRRELRNLNGILATNKKEMNKEIINKINGSKQ
jgi:3'(2'), 5'-bisphosphate nucleotidase